MCLARLVNWQTNQVLYCLELLYIPFINWPEVLLIYQLNHADRNSPVIRTLWKLVTLDVNKMAEDRPDHYIANFFDSTQVVDVWLVLVFGVHVVRIVNLGRMENLSCEALVVWKCNLHCFTHFVGKIVLSRMRCLVLVGETRCRSYIMTCCTLFNFNSVFLRDFIDREYQIRFHISQQNTCSFETKILWKWKFEVFDQICLTSLGADGTSEVDGVRYFSLELVLRLPGQQLVKFYSYNGGQYRHHLLINDGETHMLPHFFLDFWMQTLFMIILVVLRFHLNGRNKHPCGVNQRMRYILLCVYLIPGIHDSREGWTLYVGIHQAYNVDVLAFDNGLLYCQILLVLFSEQILLENKEACIWAVDHWSNALHYWCQGLSQRWWLIDLLDYFE